MGYLSDVDVALLVEACPLAYPAQAGLQAMSGGINLVQDLQKSSARLSPSIAPTADAHATFCKEPSAFCKTQLCSHHWVTGQALSRLYIADRLDIHVAINAFDQSAQNPSRAELIEVGDTSFDHIRNGILPTHTPA